MHMVQRRKGAWSETYSLHKDVVQSVDNGGSCWTTVLLLLMSASEY